MAADIKEKAVGEKKTLSANSMDMYFICMCAQDREEEEERERERKQKR